MSVEMGLKTHQAIPSQIMLKLNVLYLAATVHGHVIAPARHLVVKCLALDLNFRCGEMRPPDTLFLKIRRMHEQLTLRLDSARDTFGNLSDWLIG